MEELIELFNQLTEEEKIELLIKMLPIYQREQKKGLSTPNF